MSWLSDFSGQVLQYYYLFMLYAFRQYRLGWLHGEMYGKFIFNWSIIDFANLRLLKGKHDFLTSITILLSYIIALMIIHSMFVCLCAHLLLNTSDSQTCQIEVHIGKPHCTAFKLLLLSSYGQDRARYRIEKIEGIEQKRIKTNRKHTSENCQML